MYEKYLERQIKVLETLQNEQNAVEVSREILKLVNELDRINDEPEEITVKAEIDGRELYKSFKSMEHYLKPKPNKELNEFLKAWTKEKNLPKPIEDYIKKFEDLFSVIT